MTECTNESMEELINKAICRISYINQRMLTASITNKEAFLKYRGAFRGKDVVLVAAGPTVKDFVPIDNAIYVGCNRAFLLDKVQFDFLFTIDKVGINEYYEEFFEYRKDTCIKFVGDQNLGKDWQIPEDIIPLNDKTFRYITNAGIAPETWYYPLDISISPLLNPPTVTLQAMQFILYTQPKRIYIVGVDCTCATKKHFAGSDSNIDFRNEDAATNDINSIKCYKKLKLFAETYYPNTEIISVNPIGLKGIFKDIFTESYKEKTNN